MPAQKGHTGTVLVFFESNDLDQTDFTRCPHMGPATGRPIVMIDLQDAYASLNYRRFAQREL